MTVIRLSVGIVLVIATGLSSQRAGAEPLLNVLPDPVFFGDGELIGAPPGVQQIAFVTLENSGDQPLDVAGMVLSGDGAGIIVFRDGVCGPGTSCPGFTIAANARVDFTLGCLPTQPGILSASLEITSNAAASPRVMPISCLANRPPVIEVTPDALDFGTQHSCWPGDSCGPSCATGSPSQTLTIRNAAAPPSELIFTLSLPGHGPFDEFTISAGPFSCDDFSCDLVLDAGESIDIDFLFHPLGGHPQSYDQPLQLVPQAPGGPPIDIPFHALGGFGRLAIDTPALLGSGAVGVPISSTITVHNAGVSCLDITDVSFMGDLRLVGPPGGLLLQAGESFSWSVTCTPQTVAGGNGDVTWNYAFDNANFDSASFYCAGIGAALFADPATAYFFDTEAVPLGTSGTRRVHVSNGGNQPTDLVAMTGSDARFTANLVTGSLPITLAPGDSVDVDVSFTPSSVDRVFGTITFDGATGDDFELSIGGDVVVAAVVATPTGHDFGRVDVPATPAADFELHNTGTATLTVGAIALELPNDFAVTGIAAGDTIAPGMTRTFTVRATPTTLGRRHATLVVDLGPVPPIRIALDALARDPALGVTTGDATSDDDALAFGRVDVDVPRRELITLHNATPSPITLASCSITGDPAFTIAPCAVAIAPSADAVLEVGFAPTAEADAVATLTITSPGIATGALRIELTGTGFDQHLALSTTAVQFDATFRHPASAATAVVTVQNTQAEPLALSTISVSGAGFMLIGPALATIEPAGHADITIGFAPTAIGAWTGQLVLGNTDDPQIARVTLAGVGISRDLAVGPLVSDLGTVPVGSTVRLGALMPDAISIRNLDAVARFTITSVQLTGDPDFRLIGPSPATLGPGERSVLDLELTPTTAGEHAAAIEIFIDGDPEPFARLTVSARALATMPSGDGCGCTARTPDGSLAVLVLVAALLVVPKRPRAGQS